MRETQITTISSANQTAVPSNVRHKLSLKPGDKLIWKMHPVTNTIEIHQAPRKWGQHMKSLNRNLLHGTDPQNYISSLREEKKTDE